MGYHPWLNRPTSAREIQDVKLVTAIETSFKTSDRTYGACRLWRDVLEEAIFLADRVLVLPRGKGAVPRLIHVDPSRLRDRNDAAFVAMRRQLMGAFELH